VTPTIGWMWKESVPRKHKFSQRAASKAGHVFLIHCLLAFWTIFSNGTLCNAFHKALYPTVITSLAITFDTDVGGLEIRFQVVGTRFILSELGVRNSNFTASPAGTPPVGSLDDVISAADVPVVHLDAATELHPAVSRMRHEDHVIDRARGVESFRLTVRRHAFDATYTRIRERQTSHQGCSAKITAKKWNKVTAYFPPEKNCCTPRLNHFYLILWLLCQMRVVRFQ